MKNVLTIGLSFVWLVSTAVRAAQDKPNIVLIMADDLGWTDLSCAGSGYYETPNIDRLASEGLTFSSYYVCQNCAPTRAALISGQYAPRTGVYTVGTPNRGRAENRKMIPPPNSTKLPLEKITIAQAMRTAGYVTGMFGKWHLGAGPKHHPGKRGFDEAIVSNGRHFNFVTNPRTEVKEGEYLADYLTDRAVDFIKRRHDKPFFLYLPHFAVHTPIQAKKELIPKYKKKPPAGGHNDPVYAAMIQSVDESVGRIMKTLDESGIADNTLVIFTSDNGGLGGYPVPGTDKTKGITDNAPLHGGKGMLYEGGVRVPFIARWPKVVPKQSKCDEPIVHVDLYPTFVDLAGAEPPEDYILDGVSFASLLAKPAGELDREAIYWHMPGYLQAYIKEATWRTTPVSVIRMGDYKLMEFYEDGRLELYNLAGDLSETTNLADQQPEKASQLHEKLKEWLKRTNARLPRFKPKGSGSVENR